MKIDRYEILDKLGSGGFGDVYRARHVELGREDAIKILHSAYSNDPSALGRFVNEARAASRIDHPGIVRVYDVGTTEGRAYCVMELLVGKTLRAVLEQGPLPLDEAFPLLARIATALDAAHASGVVHRDLKPENVIVQRDGSPKIIDFGLARLVADESVTTTGRVMGSPRYMSPEQCRGKPSDARSDAYSFGALAYHVLVGEPPFDGDALALALHHLNDDPVPPSRRRADLPHTIDLPVQQLLHKDPGRRPQQLAAAVERMRGKVASRPRRWRWLVASMLAIAGGSAAHALHSRSTHERTPWMLVDQFDLDSGNTLTIGRDGSSMLSTGSLTRWIALVTHAETPLSDGFVAELPDHRQVTFDDETLRLSDGTSKQALADHVKAVQVSHDQKTIAVVRNDAIELVSLATLQHRTLTSVDPGTRAAQWSGDDKVISWIGNEIVHLTDVSTGATRSLSIPLIQDLGPQRVALLDETHLVYCSDEGGHRAIRLRSTDRIGDSGQLIRELDPKTATCSVSVDGHRVAIAASRGRLQVGVFDLATRTLRAAATELDVFLDRVSRDGQEFLVDNNQQRYDAIDRATSVREAWWIGACGGGPVQWGTKWGYMKTGRTGGTLELTDDACRTVARWELPPQPIQRLVCRNEQCLGLSLSDKLRIWSLVPNEAARLLAELPASQTRDYEADLSRDGRRVVVYSSQPQEFKMRVIGPDGVRDVPNFGGELQGAVWAPDNDDLIVSGVSVDGYNYVVLRIHPDGSRELLHASNSEWIEIVDRARGELFGLLRSVHSSVFVYDIAL
jgi:Protein kinase domain